MSIYQYDVINIKGVKQTLCEYKGKVLLIVNTASKCGFTPQFKELQDLYEKYRDKGFEVLGFPCNQFNHQDPGNEREIEEFCQLNYGVTFPMFSKIEVNGKNAHPLYQYLKQESAGFLGTKMIKWNFTKFIINQEGKVVSRHAPTVKPSILENEINTLLG